MTQIATAIREVRNAGKRAGDEVVQPYLRPVEPLRPRAFKELRGVERVTLKAGESRVVRFSISPARDLAIYDDVNKAYAVDAGQFEVQIGASSADIRAKAALDVTH
ncbi:MAG: fibronectin type III-like domain-contianing protein [Pseudomonadota bacterium]